MSNPSISTGQECSPPPDSLPIPEIPTPYQIGYQQALADFAIADLLHRLHHFDVAWGKLDPQEAETIAALLIQALSHPLNDNLLVRSLTALRQPNLDISPALASLKLPPSTPNFPIHFPEVETPRFLYGDRLCWICNGEVSDRGRVIGRFYSFAPHRCCWDWCYLIWLDAGSPSSAWVRADIAWEEDLQLEETR